MTCIPTAYDLLEPIVIAMAIGMALITIVLFIQPLLSVLHARWGFWLDSFRPTYGETCKQFLRKKHDRKKDKRKKKKAKG